MRAWKIGLAVWLAAASSTVPSAAQTDEGELAEAGAELERLRTESVELTEQYQAAWAADAELQTRIDQLESSISAYGVELRQLRGRIRERAVDLYMNGAEGGLASLFFTASPADLDTRSEYLLDIRVRDRALVNGMEALSRRLETADRDLRADKEEHERVLARFEEVAVDLNRRLEEGQAAYLALQYRLEEERAREEARIKAEEEALAAEAAASQPADTTQPAAPPATRDTAATTTTTSATQPPATTAEPTTTTSTTQPAAATDTTTTTAGTTTTTTSTTQPAAATEPAAATAGAATTTQPATTDTTEPAAAAEPNAPTGEELAAPGEEPAEPDQEPEGMTESGMVCPVDGFHTFTDTWGAPRSGGRRHEGVDFMAARGTPVAAVTDGVIKRLRTGGLGGITVRLVDAKGDEYYYAHLDSRAPGLSVGQEVRAGGLLGTVGTTGNSPDHIPHLHWEFLPGGGKAVNPTPLARRLCG